MGGTGQAGAGRGRDLQSLRFIPGALLPAPFLRPVVAGLISWAVAAIGPGSAGSVPAGAVSLGRLEPAGRAPGAPGCALSTPSSERSRRTEGSLAAPAHVHVQGSRTRSSGPVWPWTEGARLDHRNVVFPGNRSHRRGRKRWLDAKGVCRAGTVAFSAHDLHLCLPGVSLAGPGPGPAWG